jgi:cation transport regulator ChaB
MARLLLVLTLTGLVLAACGGDTEEKNEYVDALNSAQERYADAASGFGSDPERYGADIKKLTEATDTLIADIEALDPPDEVQEQHDDIIAALREFNGSVKPVTDELNSDDPAQAATAAQVVATSAARFGSQFDTAVDEINSELQN